MVQKLNRLIETASQTAGPYVHIGALPNHSGIPGIFPEDLGIKLVNDKTKGERITVSGQVIDGSGTVARDALVEIWQADAEGLYNSPSEMRGSADPNFTGWGRSACDGKDDGFSFETIKPGSVPFFDGRNMAPHITFWIVARGINLGLQTRMYFPEDEAAIAADPILSRIEHKVRVPTLIAKKTGDGTYQFDIRLQGEGETVFFDI